MLRQECVVCPKMLQMNALVVMSLPMSVRTQYSAFLRERVGCVALLLAGRIHGQCSFKNNGISCVALLLADRMNGQSSFKNHKVFIPSSVDLPLSALNTF